MSNMKCPFCQQELDTGNYYVRCHNPGCNMTAEMEGTEEMWAALIRTRRALNVAVDALKEIEHYTLEQELQGICTKSLIAEQALEQITALEQKD